MHQGGGDSSRCRSTGELLSIGKKIPSVELHRMPELEWSESAAGQHLENACLRLNKSGAYITFECTAHYVKEGPSRACGFLTQQGPSSTLVTQSSVLTV